MSNDRKHRFRWTLVTVPALVGLGMWLYHHWNPERRFQYLMAGMGIIRRDRFSALMILAVLLIAMLAIIRILIGDRNPKE